MYANVHTSSIAHWKAHGRLPVRDSWTIFASSYSRDIKSRNLSKSAFFEGSGSLWAKILGGRGRRLLTTVGIRKKDWLYFHMVSKYWQYMLLFCQNARVWQIDRQTDGRQNYNTQNRASIAASCDKNIFKSNNTGYNKKLITRCTSS